MLSPNGPQWPFISTDQRPLFFKPEPIKSKPPTYTSPWTYIDHPPQKRRHADEGYECEDVLEPIDLEHATLKSQHTLPRKVRVTPTLLAHQNARHFRISHIGDYFIKWACEHLRPVSRGLQQRLQSITKEGDFHTAEARKWEDEGTDWVEEQRKREEGHKSMRRKLEKEKEWSRREYHATVQHVEDSEEDGESSSPMRGRDAVFKNVKEQTHSSEQCFANKQYNYARDEDFELDIEWAPCQHGLVSERSLVLRNSHGTQASLVDNLPPLINCEDELVSMTLEDGRVVLRDVDGLQEVGEDSGSPSSSNSSLLSHDVDSSDDSNLWICETGRCDIMKAPIPEAPIGDLLPAYLRPICVPEIPESETRKVKRTTSFRPTSITPIKQVCFENPTSTASPKPLRLTPSLVHIPQLASPTTPPLHMSTAISRIWGKCIEEAKNTSPSLIKQYNPTPDMLFIPKLQKYLKATHTSMLVEKSILKSSLRSNPVHQTPSSSTTSTEISTQYVTTSLQPPKLDLGDRDLRKKLTEELTSAQSTSGSVNSIWEGRIPKIAVHPPSETSSQALLEQIVPFKENVLNAPTYASDQKNQELTKVVLKPGLGNSTLGKKKATKNVLGV